MRFEKEKKEAASRLYPDRQAVKRHVRIAKNRRELFARVGSFSGAFSTFYLYPGY